MMRVWHTMRNNEGKERAVKKGFCWPMLVACLLPFGGIIFYLWRRLWVSALIYALVLLLLGLALNHMPDRETTPWVIHGIVRGAMFIAVIYVFVFPAATINDQTLRALDKRGWSVTYRLSANSEVSAILESRKLSGEGKKKNEAL